MDVHNTQYWAHCAAAPLMHIGLTSHLVASSPPRTRHPIPACAPVCCFLSVLFLVFFVFYLVSPFSFQPFLVSTSALNERSRSNPLCDFRLGTVVTSDYETPLTGYEPEKDLNLTNAEELDPRYHQWYLLPAHPGRHGFLPQRSRRRRQPACEIPCSCGR